MRRGMLGMALGMLMMMGCGRAEAGVGDWLKNTAQYAVSPVNCLTELGADLFAASSKFVLCFLSNMNRNPATLDPLIHH